MHQGRDAVTTEDLAAGFKAAMRLHVAGVCIISIGSGESANGMAATAVTSFSIEPPSMLICVNKAASISQDLREGERFGLTILGRHHEEVAAAFSRKPAGRARFRYDQWRLDADEPPWLADAPANLACVVEDTMAYGSHRAIIGRVEAVRLGPVSASLIYRDGTYQ